MIQFSVNGILLDIEGTTSSVTFVYDVMFPYVREHLTAYLGEHWGEAKLFADCEQMATDGGHPSLAAMAPESLPAAARQARVAAEVIRQMDADMKTTGLKSLQGDIWKAGFESGELVAHVYDDVVPCIRSWRAQSLPIRIYSSGSVAAQKLFFGHTQAGDLLPLFDGHYDTTVGSKRSAASYAAIARDWGLSPERLLFVSDVVAELDAARDAGLATVLCCRGEMLESDHPTCQALDEIAAVRL